MIFGKSTDSEKKVLTKVFGYAIIIKQSGKRQKILGCRQAVRQRTLTPSFRKFESFHPSQKPSYESMRAFYFSDFKKRLQSIGCFLSKNVIQYYLRKINLFKKG